MLIPQLDRLKAQLLTSGLSQKNQPLYQIIRDLINAIRQSVDEIAEAAGIPGGGGGSTLFDKNYITWTNELASLPNSRNLLAGTGITFDDSVVGQRTVNVSIVEKEWSVLTNGDTTMPELVFAGGDVIMTHIP